MARPREHDERTRAALIAAAEKLLAEGGPEALSVRAVAEAVGTTTRAVYSLFGGKEGLVDELAGLAFDYLRDAVAAHLETDDPAADLAAMGPRVYRRFVREHPSYYRIAFQRIVPGFQLDEALAARRAAGWRVLEAKVRRLEAAGLLRDRSVTAAAVEFNALCEGLANAELRGGTMRGDGEEVWRDAFETLVRGLTS